MRWPRWERSGSSGSGTWRALRGASSGGHRRRRQGLGPRAEGRRTWSVVYDASEPTFQAHSSRWSSRPDGISYAGTGPSGQVVNLTDPKHPASRPDPRSSTSGTWRAISRATCGGNRPERASSGSGRPQGQWSLLYDSKSTHLLCVAVGPDGSIYAGSDGEGLIYRVSHDGKATVLFDAPQSEIRTLLWRGDGALYAGTAAEAGGGDAGRRSMFLAAGGSPPCSGQPRLGRQWSFAGRCRDGRQVKKAASQARPPGGPGQPRPATPGRPASEAARRRPGRSPPGDNAVYRLDADGVAARGLQGQGAGPRPGLGR